jgi:hypothetical protein
LECSNRRLMHLPMRAPVFHYFSAKQSISQWPSPKYSRPSSNHVRRVRLPLG